jgi:hypothetical protein
MQGDIAFLTEDGKLRVFRGSSCTQSFDASCFGWSSSGRSVAIGLGDAASVFSSQSGKRMLHLGKAAPNVSTVLFCVPNYLFVSSSDAVIRVFEAEAGKPSQLVSGLEGHQSSTTITCLAFSRSHLASCSLSGDILLHNLERATGTSLCSSSDDMGFNKIAFRPSLPTNLVSVAESGALRMWDVNRCGGGPVMSFCGDDRGHNGPATDLAFADLNTVVTVGLDGFVLLHDLRSKSPTMRLDAGSSLQCADFDARGTTLAIGKDDGTAEFFDLRAGQLRAGSSVVVEAGVAVQGLRFAPNSSAAPVGARAFVIPALPPAKLEKFVMGVASEAPVEYEAPDGPLEEETTAPEMLFSPARELLKSPVFSFRPALFDEGSATAQPWHSARSSSEPHEEQRNVESTPINVARKDTVPLGVAASPPVSDAAPSVQQTSVTVDFGAESEKALNILRLQMHRQMRAMHVDMMRQFHEQQQEVRKLQQIVSELTAENYKLRMQQP